MSNEAPDHSPGLDCLPEDKPAPRPEDFIGQMVDSDHRVESIEAIGSKFVVFKVRNLKTDEIDQILKVLRQTFDPRAPLLAGLTDAIKNGSPDPDRLVRICDRLLTIDGGNEAAAFNKGVALLTKKQPSAALEAFNLAVTLAPRDLLNLVHRAACLGALQRDHESLRDLQAAADLDNARLQEVLASLTSHAITIRQVLRRLTGIPATREVARQALRRHFGFALQLRLSFRVLKPNDFFCTRPTVRLLTDGNPRGV